MRLEVEKECISETEIKLNFNNNEQLLKFSYNLGDIFFLYVCNPTKINDDENYDDYQIYINNRTEEIIYTKRNKCIHHKVSYFIPN